MKDETTKARLQIVPKVTRREITPEDFQPIGGTQSNLFPSGRPDMLIFVYFSEVTEEEFRKTLEFARPSAVLELRNTPRFDIGRLNRQSVFKFFASQHTAYFDLTSWRAKQAGDNNLLNHLRKIFEKNLRGSTGPIMFLLSSDDDSDALSRQIVDIAYSVKKTAPEVFAVPQFRSDQAGS